MGDRTSRESEIEEILDAVNKRANSDQSDEQPYRKDEYDEKDYLSRTPKLCQLKIFNYLTRNDIYKMSFLNSKMHEIAVDKSLNKIKFAGGKLWLYQTDRGYGIYFDIRRSLPASMVDVEFLYECWEENGSHVEKRQIIQHNTMPSGLHTRHTRPVPDEFFTALSELLRDKEVETLEICDIPFDSFFFDRLSTVLADHNTKSIECTRMFCAAMTDEIRNSFARFISRAEVVDLRTSGDSASLLSEEFLRNLGKSSVCNYLSPPVDARQVLLYDLSFPLPEPVLFSLLRFDSLDAPSAVVGVGCVANFMMAFMDSRVDSTPMRGNWKFAVDALLTAEMLKNRFSQAATDFGYEGQTEDGGLDYTITRKSDGMMVNVLQQKVQVNGRSLHAVDILFMKPEMLAHVRREVDEDADEDEKEGEDEVGAEAEE